jgi:hypothetical protein
MQQSSRSVEGVVELPRTATRRGACAWLTLVRRVNLDPKVPAGIAWEGRRYRPGRLVSVQELFEGVAENCSPIVLEATEAEDPEYKGPRRRWTLLWILWRYEQRTKAWMELGRVLSPGSYTSMELRQLGAQALRQDVWRELESLDESAERIHSFIHQELVHLGDRKGPILELVLHQLVSRLVDERGTVDWPIKRSASREPNPPSRSITA